MLISHKRYHSANINHQEKMQLLINKSTKPAQVFKEHYNGIMLQLSKIKIPKYYAGYKIAVHPLKQEIAKNTYILGMVR